MEGIRRALVLGLVLIAGTAIEQAPSVGALVYVFVGFWDVDYVSQLPYVWYYVGVKSSFQHAREECESKRAHVF